MLTELKVKIGQYSETPNGKWLKDFDWSSVPVTFKDKFPGDVAGYYSFGKIVLLNTDIFTIFPIYVHELRHRWQWKKNPLKYIIGKLYRPLIQNDAYKQQQCAQNWFLNII